MTQGTCLAVIAQLSGRQEALWQAALASQAIGVRSIAPARVRALDDLVPPDLAVDLLVADLRILASASISPEAMSAAQAVARPEGLLVLSLGSRLEVTEPERRWGIQRGAFDLVPARTLSPLDERAASGLARIVAALGREFSVAAYNRAMSRLAEEAARVEGDPAAVLAHRGVSIEEVAARLRGPAGVPVADRRFHLTTYEQCFVGSEAVDWLATNYGLSRELATALGRVLQGHGWLYHVVKEQPFQDGHYFFRFTEDLRDDQVMELGAVIDRMRGPRGVSILDRTYLGRTYPECFIGTEATDWLSRTYGMTRSGAVVLGQRLMDLQLVRHVLDGHDFTDAGYYYQFCPMAMASRR